MLIKCSGFRHALMKLLSFESPTSLFMPPIALGNLPFSIALVCRSVESFNQFVRKFSL
jgi:hypothetical protein